MKVGDLEEMLVCERLLGEEELEVLLNECEIEVGIGEEKKVVSCRLVGWFMYSSRVIAVELWFVRSGKGERKNRRLSASFDILAGEVCVALVLFACSGLGRVTFVFSLSIVVGTKEA